MWSVILYKSKEAVQSGKYPHFSKTVQKLYISYRNNAFLNHQGSKIPCKTKGFHKKESVFETFHT